MLRLYSLGSYLTTVGMWQADFTVELSWRAGWWQSIMLGCMLEVETTCNVWVVIVRMKRRANLYRQNVEWFGSHNWITQHLWPATLIFQKLPGRPKGNQWAFRRTQTTSPVLLSVSKRPGLGRKLAGRRAGCQEQACKPAGRKRRPAVTMKPVDRPPGRQDQIPMQVFIDTRNMCGSSRPGSITSSHPPPTLLSPEPLFHTNSLWMLGEERRSVDDGLSAF